jgi:hypothetical protein
MKEATMYVGIYKVPKNGVVPINKPRFRVMNYYLGFNSSGTMKDNRVTFIIEQDYYYGPKRKKSGFWPVIIKMSDREAKRLGNLLLKASSKRKEQVVE